ncbi:MAG: lysine--tRNA ligase [Rhodobacteraceae bacterium]|nr:MAG: lysine--tRNA ligase [Paracoccaceae bacterium]
MSKKPNDTINSTAWPFLEARRLFTKLEGKIPKKGYVLFETGYGPSGLPHIGTFGEVMRTSMVRRAFEAICDIPTKLICFSDDMDGLRKVPMNIPEPESLEIDLNLPLTQVRDPFGEYPSFAHYNNAKLREFLDRYEFSYDFVSSTDYYKSGYFDETLLKILGSFDQIMDIMLPSLGTERQASYSPFMPISKKSGHVLQVPTEEINLKKGTLIYKELDGEKVETEVTGGNVKLQWKPDWAMRWCALDVDYEMHGKDLIPSADLGKKICKVLSHKSPNLYNYELFLDEKGQKISKSKGNGLSMADWLTYAEPNSLGLFMYQKPKTAKRLFFDVIPKTVDEYHQHLKNFSNQSAEERFKNPVWHIHSGKPPRSDLIIPFSMLLNLVSASGASNKDTLWGFIEKYVENISPISHPGLDLAVNYAITYYKDFVQPKKVFRAPDEREREAFGDLCVALASCDKNSTAEELQQIVYKVGVDNGFVPLKQWFKAIYEVLLGESQGPRFGGFVAIYGIGKTVALIKKALNGELINN